MATVLGLGGALALSAQLVEVLAKELLEGPDAKWEPRAKYIARLWAMPVFAASAALLVTRFSDFKPWLPSAVCAAALGLPAAAALAFGLTVGKSRLSIWAFLAIGAAALVAIVALLIELL